MDHSLRGAPCLYFVTTDDGTILSVNDTLCRRLGYTAGELAGEKIDRFLPVATRIFQQTHLFPLLKMQGFAEEIFVHLRPRTGEDLPVLLNAERRVGERAELHYAGIVVRNRKTFEEELIAARRAAETALEENTALLEAKRALQQQAEALDRQMEQTKRQNDELQQFNRVVTHDLQEPLRKLQVFANMILEDGSPDGRHPALLKVRRVTGQLRDIINGLQQYVWLNDAPLRRNTIDLEPMLRAAAARIEPEFEGVRLHLELPAGIGLSGDREQLQWLFYELLYNAVRFRSKPDSVRVDVSAETVKHNRYRNVEDRYEYTDQAPSASTAAPAPAAP
ncbi:MAG: PAS domain-containing sensor histidine kinase [Chitinophagaceae bacterium]|nr:MAG: PAS domain-containing sensor histidine kinase [Chitinophagaceae bacterium]